MKQGAPNGTQMTAAAFVEISSSENCFQEEKTVLLGF